MAQRIENGRPESFEPSGGGWSDGSGNSPQPQLSGDSDDNTANDRLKVSAIVLAKGAMIALGIVDTLDPSVSMPSGDAPETFIDPLLYGGVFKQAMVLENWAYNALVNELINGNLFNGDSYYFFHTVAPLLESARYLAQQLTSELTSNLYGLASVADSFGAITQFTSFVTQGIVPNYPADRAQVSSKNAARGQDFQFYFRSLKPSIFKEDLTPFDGNPLNKIAPKGIMRLKPIINNLSESYKPNWEKQNILGNVQQLHRYVRTDRSISINFSLFADSYQQMQFNIWRLNWLANHCYGKLMNFDSFKATNQEDRSKFVQNVEYKEFPFIKITVGTVLVEVPCYIDSMGVTYDMKNPWEMGDDIINRVSKWKNLQFPFKVDITLSLNVLYNVLDPTENNFYRQYFGTENNYLRWTKDAGNTNPDDDPPKSLLGNVAGAVGNLS